MPDIICGYTTVGPNVLKNFTEVLSQCHHINTSRDARRKLKSLWITNRENPTANFFDQPYQLASQLGLYCENKDNDTFTTFVDHPFSEEESENYLKRWIWRYYVPNPLTNGFINVEHPKLLVQSLIDYLLLHPGPQRLLNVCCDIFCEENIGNLPELKKILSYAQVFNLEGERTNIYISLRDDYEQIMCELTDIDRADRRAFYENFNLANATQNVVAWTPDKTKEKLSYLTALHTKPFLILSGISGTGKSQLVRELAYMTCPRPEDIRVAPRNYQLISVKPNWHDSSEVLGYYSAVNHAYMLTDFVRFIYKATKDASVPYFLCLDEMNLAPVEQYFAEYLSVLETRKLNTDLVIESDFIIKKEDLKGSYAIEGNAFDTQILEYIRDHKGLTIPDNLFVIGTVNVDDTTHQISRKVIDRAFTLEMNGGSLDDIFQDQSVLTYSETPLPLHQILPRFTRAKQVTDFYEDYAESIKKLVPLLLSKVNKYFENTPFTVSYRVENEFVLYIAALIEERGSAHIEDINSLIVDAFFHTLMEKILPRVSGDDRLLKLPLIKLYKFVDRGIVEEDGAAEESIEVLANVETSDIKRTVLNKLTEMSRRLETSYFTSFFA